MTRCVVTQLTKNKENCKHYQDEIDKSLKQFGPYYLLPNVILLHGRPNPKYSNALTIIKLNTAFASVENNLPVKLIIGMTSEDSNAHLKLLKHLVDKLKVHENVVQLLSAETNEEIVKIVASLSKEEVND